MPSLALSFSLKRSKTMAMTRLRTTTFVKSQQAENRSAADCTILVVSASEQGICKGVDLNSAKQNWKASCQLGVLSSTL